MEELGSFHLADCCVVDSVCRVALQEVTFVVFNLHTCDLPAATQFVVNFHSSPPST